MNLEATKHITMLRAAFDTHKVIFPRNMRLGHDSVVEAIRMGCIVVGVESRGIKNRICIANVFHMPKLQANLLFMSNVLSYMLNVQFLIYWWRCKCQHG